MIYISEGKRVYSAYKYIVNIIILWNMASDTTVALIFTKSKKIYTTDLYLHEKWLPKYSHPKSTSSSHFKMQASW